MHVQKCAVTQLYANKYTENQVCKLFALTEGAVTLDMSKMPWEKLQKI